MNIYFNGKRTARRRQSDGAVFYFFSDHLGSARVVTNASGTIVEESDFYPFGGERIIVDSLGNNYKFTAQERDTETGLDYFIARHYSPGPGRFLQPDEFVGGPVDAFSANDPLLPGPLPYADITNPQSLNKYSYTYNNPLRHTDPNGHAGKEIADSIDRAVDGAVASLIRSTAESGANPRTAALIEDAAQFTGEFIKGQADVLRLGTGTSNAIDAGKQGDILAAGAELAPDLRRAGQVILTVVGFSVAAGLVAGPNEEAGAQLKRLSKGEIKKLKDANQDPEKLKTETTGIKKTSGLDLFKDRQGNIFVKPRDSKGPGEATGLNINDLEKQPK